MSFYRSAMRNGPAILFWAAVAVLVLTFLYALAFALHMAGGQGGSVIMSPPPNDNLAWIAVSALVSAISAAVWPFFGAVVCYFIERRWPEAAE